jgi:hypothetical protein
MRPTEENLNRAFENYCWAMGKEVGHHPGTWHLDYDEVYGGYCIVETLEKGITHPISMERRELEEMYETLRFGIQTIRYLKEKKPEGWVSIQGRGL